ncbi:hypothetical protein ACJMK2_038624 [Sinanodonta woodiana]|uniref:DUF985 domain-containing protein n=1 Tax=Sinanodonta woodiana TaxID=1069815 RepID=A0ABD3WBG4_SINWO
MAEHEIESLKKSLNLQPHPEGGAFIELWKGDRNVKFLGDTKHDGARATGTSIHYLLVSPSFVSWHRHLSDEIFFWHAGGPLRINMIQKDGSLVSHTLGNVLLDPSCVYQVIVPHDTWYSAELVDMKPYCLYSAVVMPGFEYQDWFPADRIKLTAEFPQHEEIISRLAKST